MKKQQFCKKKKYILMRNTSFFQIRLQQSQIRSIAFHRCTQKNVIALAVSFIDCITDLINDAMFQCVFGCMAASRVCQYLHIRIIFFQSPGNGAADQAKANKPGSKGCFHFFILIACRKIGSLSSFLLAFILLLPK